MGLSTLLVAGPPASGKTVLGAALARRLGATLLDQDALTGPLTSVIADLLGTDELDNARLAEATRSARYETLYAAAIDNLAAGNPVVLVAPFTAERRDPDAWQRVADRLAAAGGGPVLVWLRVTPELVRARMSARAADRDREKLADLAAFLDRVDLGPPAARHLAVNAAAPTADQVRAVLDGLAAPSDPTRDPSPTRSHHSDPRPGSRRA
ncbi:Predicted kinase [Asanoa hainanensis]|uniref:Predicted kinase n=1 Tax=Asanoa hainanensis TaxID=560556 RepID=A0A239NLQ5_9ACTN|nr:ATP-binding protein [Asanoa hainanensis]SNT55288.1 Predicted kinase [Asanoa hainanensis]